MVRRSSEVLKWVFLTRSRCCSFNKLAREFSKCMHLIIEFSRGFPTEKRASRTASVVDVGFLIQPCWPSFEEVPSEGKCPTASTDKIYCRNSVIIEGVTSVRLPKRVTDASAVKFIISLGCWCTFASANIMRWRLSECSLVKALLPVAGLSREYH